MMTESRNERLASDYREMLKIQNRPYLSWIVTKGEPPFAEEYLLTVRLRSYTLSATEDSYVVSAENCFTIRITLWDSYPHKAPNIRMLSIPPVFHPNWYSKGSYCPSEPWREEYTLKDYVMKMLKALIYEPSFIETAAPANYKALEWYMKDRDNINLFPSDKTELTENSPQETAYLEESAKQRGEIIDSWKKH